MGMHGTAQPVQRMTFIGFPWLDMRKEQEIRTVAADVENLRMTLYHRTDIVLGHALQHFFRKNLMCNNIWHRTLLVLASRLYYVSIIAQHAFDNAKESAAFRFLSTNPVLFRAEEHD